MQSLHSSRQFIFAWGTLLLLFLVAAMPPEPPAPILEQDPPRRPPVVAAWLRGATTGERSMVVTVASQVSAYSEISAFSYTIEADGSLTANRPVSDTVLVDLARINGIRVVPTISSTWVSTNIARVLRDANLRAKHIENIMKVGRSPLVDGIDIDYENLPPDTRQQFSEFVTTLATQLHSEGKTLSITVPPKVREDEAATITRFADYAAIGAAADHVRVMAYEFHGKSGGPAPNAPIWWVRRVMEYTISQMPRQKAILGIHLYAYDWGGQRHTGDVVERRAAVEGTLSRTGNLRRIGCKRVGGGKRPYLHHPRSPLSDS